MGKISNIPEVAGSGTSGSALTCGFGKFGTAFDDKCFVAGCFDDAFGVGRVVWGWTDDGPADDSSDSLSESRTSFGSSPDIDSIKSFHLKQCLNNVSSTYATLCELVLNLFSAICSSFLAILTTLWVVGL